MIYTVRMKYADTGELAEEFTVRRATFKEAEEYAKEFALTLSKLPLQEPREVVFDSVFPLTNSPTMTAQDVFNLPGEPITWWDTVLEKTIIFLNQLDGYQFDAYHVDSEKMALAKRISVETKFSISHDSRRSTSLYVIVFDFVSVGFLIGSGREERNEQVILTNKQQAFKMAQYILENYKMHTCDQIADVNQVIPWLWDWMDENRQFEER